METTAIAGIRDRFIDHISQLEELQDEMFTTLSELASPAYYNSSLPTFTKRPTTGSQDSKSSGGAGGYGGNTPPTRSMQLKITVEKWRQVLGKFRERIETCDSLQSAYCQEMINVIEESGGGSGTGACEKFPMMLAPALTPLEESLMRCNTVTKNKIVSSRLESALQLFKTMIRGGKEVCMLQWTTTEAACDTQQVMVECLLKMFYKDLYNISVTLKHFYDKKLSVDAKKFCVYTEHQKELALAHQMESYKEMCKSIRSQTCLFKDMMKCLNDELDNVPLSGPCPRAKSKKKLEELRRRSEEILVHAEVYYEASRKVVLPQSMSTYFYKEVRRWLHDYQVILIENLSAIMVGGSAPHSPPDSKDIRSSGGLRGGLDSSSVLHGYAKRLDPSKLIDITSIGSLIKPGGDMVNEILLGFTQFHLNNNKQNLTSLKRSIDKMFVDYETLKKDVQEMVRVQQHFYNSKEAKLPSVLDYHRGASMAPPELRSCPPASSSGYGTAGGYGTPPPEVIKQLLKLDRDLKISEGRLQSMYNSLFNVMGQEYSKLEQQNVKLAEIVEYLKQYAVLMRDWEEKIKQEQTFIQKWKEIRKYNSRHMSLQFMEWNHFVTEEVDVFHKTIGLYSVNIFHKIKEKANDFMSQILSFSNRRNEELEGEIKLLANLYNDVRGEDLGAGDDLIRMQGAIEQWIGKTNGLYQVYFEHRLKTVIMYYLSALESLLDRFDDESELGVLLKTLDNMYDITTETAEEEKESRKSKFLLKGGI